MAYSRDAVVKQAENWIGCKESDGSHRKIIDTYNAHKPLARGYKVKYTDPWCATFVSAVSIKCGYTDIIPTECGCPNMIQLFKNLGEWKEDDSYKPDPGDVIFYDWQDSGSGDNQGTPDHVGIVEKLSGSTITVIEGNKNNAVGRRTLKVNGRYIRGYGLPKYGNTTAGNKAVDTETAQPETIWNYLMGKIGNAYGVAGLMGNLYAESGLKPTNLQNSYEKKLGLTDQTYTAAVDNGSYTNFARDSAGYGLAQWTYWSRKQALKAYADSQRASIGNLNMQLGFLIKELTEGYASVLSTLKNAKSILEASNAVLTKFERPADQGTAVQAKRAAYGQKYFDEYAGKPGNNAASGNKPLAGTPTFVTGKEYTLQVNLNVRTGPGTNYAKKTRAQLTADGRKHADASGTLRKGTVVTCQQVKIVSGNIWIKAPSGWLAAYYGGEVYIK